MPKVTYAKVYGNDFEEEGWVRDEYSEDCCSCFDGCVECTCIYPPTASKLLKCFAFIILLVVLNSWFGWLHLLGSVFSFMSWPKMVSILPHTFDYRPRPNASLASFLYPTGSEDTCIQELSQPGVLPFKDVRDLRAMPVHAFYINVAAHSERRQRIERRFEAAASVNEINDDDAGRNDNLQDEQSAGHRRRNTSSDLGVGSVGKRMGDYHLHRIDAATDCAHGKYHCVVQSHLRAIETASNYLAVDRPNEFQDFALIMEDDITLELEAFWSVERRRRHERNA